MKNKITYSLFISLFLGIIIFFNGCKKYPENNLWFKSPALAIDGSWNLVFFEINGNDSLKSNVKLFTDSKIEFTTTGKDKLLQKHYSGLITIGNYSRGSWKLINNKKEIEIFFDSDFEPYIIEQNCPCYNLNNIFILYRTRITWKIEKLTRHDFWITTIYNSLKYELHLKK